MRSSNIIHMVEGHEEGEVGDVIIDGASLSASPPSVPNTGQQIFWARLL